MDQDFIDKIFAAHKECPECPPSSQIVDFFNELMGLLFPNFSTEPFKSEETVKGAFADIQGKMKALDQKHE